jgi:hypothetical protein
MRFTTETKYGPVVVSGTTPATVEQAERIIETIATDRAALVCPECGGGAKIIDSAAIYGRSYGPAFACASYPRCDAYVGVHRGTLTPLGTLAGPELREWRKRTHAAFDPLWRGGAMRRREAYAWMRATLGLTEDEAHIARFDVDQCRALIAAITGRPDPGGGERP